MLIRILTLFPEYFEKTLQSSILGRAQATGVVSYEVIAIRDFTSDKHRVTDDRPFGGGAGMVLKVEPIHKALLSLPKNPNRKVVLTTANGRKFKQSVAQEYSQLDELVIICGHYEGVDERVSKYLIDEEVRVGEFVLTGGEAAALVITDAVTRLIPGVLGNEDSLTGESHAEANQGAIPQYTRPENYNGWQVPEILLSGDHEKISAWRDQNRKPIKK